MAPIQLSFSLRTSPNCKTVHLVGNWDGYKGQLPLSKDPAKAGAWKGTFRFQGSTLQPGQRYWYYYIMDGYHVSHDPGKPFTTEPTTRRQLNILDVPGGDTKGGKAAPAEKAGSKGNRLSINIPKGRPLSPSRIVSPKPIKPGGTVDALTRQLAATKIPEPQSESDSEFEDSGSDSGSDVPSLSSSQSSRSSNSSPGCSTPGSDGSTGSRCSCNRFGITRKGNRVRLDCGGSRCGYSESECSDSDSDRSAAERPEYQERATRRQGVVIR